MTLDAQIIALLSRGPMRPADIIDAVHRAPAVVSRHLYALRVKGLAHPVGPRRNGVVWHLGPAPKLERPPPMRPSWWMSAPRDGFTSVAQAHIVPVPVKGWARPMSEA